MILREAINLSKSIAHYRLDMSDLAKDKGLSDPDIIKIRQQLNSRIETIQKALDKIRSF